MLEEYFTGLIETGQKSNEGNVISLGILIFRIFNEICFSLCVGYICTCLTSVGVLVECQVIWHIIENEIFFIILTSICKYI